MHPLHLGDHFDSLTAQIREALAEEPLCNSAIIVARSGFSQELIQQCKRISKHGELRLFCLDSPDLIYILNENDRSAAFSYILTK